MKRKEIYWHIYGEEKNFSDEEFMQRIKEGYVKEDDLISNRDLRVWLPLKETIYRFYLPVKE